MKYEILAFDKNDDRRLWTRDAANLGDALSIIADAHHAHAKRPLFCGLATIDADGEIDQIQITPSALGMLCDRPGDESYLIRRRV